MTAVLDRPPRPEPPTRSSSAAPDTSAGWLSRPVWKRFTALQLLVLVLATIAPFIILGTITAGLLGVISLETMTGVALAAGENPGMITFGAMFLASPVQWFTGRSQVRVRKYLGIMFFLLALSNGAMFAIEAGLSAAFSAPFLIAGSRALLLSVPLFLTSSRRSQRAIGMKKWRLLHKGTYLVALALMAHVLLIPEIGPGFFLIAGGFVLRIPAVRRWLTRRDRRRAGRPSAVGDPGGRGGT